MAEYQPVVLVADETRVSNADGTPCILWTQAFREFAAATGLRLYLTVLSCTRGATVKVFGQWSSDQRTWVDFAFGIDGYPKSSAGAGAGAQVAIDYAASFAEFGPYVRFGIQVTGDTTNHVQGDARLTATIMPLFGDAVYFSAGLASSVALSATTPTPISPTPARIVSAFKRAVVMCKISSYSPGGNIYLSATGSDNATDWATLASVTINSNGTYAIPVDPVMNYLALSYKVDSGTTATLDATAVLKQW